MTFTKLHTPKGTRDYLPSEVERYHYIEDELRKIFKLWGYQEIRSPTIEFVEVLSTGVGPELVDSMFKFQDFDGKILALRAEMTAPVTRIVTTRMSSIPEPIRLFYVSNVFRYSQSYVKRGREFWQAGVEFIGCNTSEADGEILSLLVSSLKKIGLKEVRVDVGHASLLKDLLKATGLNEEKKDILQNLLGYRDEARLEKFMDQNNLPSTVREAFLQLSSCRRLDEVSSVSVVSKYGKTEDHLTNLSEIKDILTDYKIENFVYFDFSLTRKIEYYTGIVFEASVPNLGLPLGGGGRYDDFIEKFGKLKIPATGFALEIEKCLQALTAQGFKLPEKRKKAKVLVASKFRKAATEAVNVIRDAGVVALLDVTKSDEKKLVEYAKLAEIDYVIFVDSSLEKPVTVYDTRSDVSRNVMIGSFLQRIRG